MYFLKFFKILPLFHRYLSSYNYVFVSRMIIDVARFLCMHPAIGILKTLFGMYYQNKYLIYRCPCQFKNIIDQKNEKWLCWRHFVCNTFLIGVILSSIPFCRLHFICTTFFVGVILSAIHSYLRLCQNNCDVSCDRYLRCIFKQLWLKCLPLFMADRFQLMSYLPIVVVRVAYPILSI